MASKYQMIVSVAEHTANDITKNGDTWMRFLTTAASNYKYRFKNQLLIYMQKPDAVACAEIEIWNRLGRWVNKGTKGIALLVDKDTPYKLRHVFDVSDTNSRAGYGVYLWQMAERYEAAVTESLENSFGELESHSDFADVLMDTAKNAVEDNYSDYLSDLVSVKVGSYLNELDDLNTGVWFKDALTSSIGFMLLSRCGIDPHEYYSREDFARVFDFSTPETVAILGGAASDISEMVLREIGATVKNLQMEERKQNRTFAPEQANGYNNGGNKTTERSAEYGTDLYNVGRLSPAGSERAGEPEDREIWNAAAQLPSGASGRDLHRDAAFGQAERPLGGDRPDGERDDEPADNGACEGAGRDGEPESVGSDEVGGPHEQHQEPGGGDRDDGADLQLTEPLPSVEEQQNTITEAEAETASAFAVSQEDIDAVLIRGSGVSEGKFRIYEQYLNQESAADNAKMLKEEYGIGGAYPAVSGSRLDEGHDGKGIQISRGNLSNPDASVLLSWSKVEKRIGELIAADRYLSEKEKERYPAYRREAADRAARWKISEDFRALIYDYNDYWTQLGEPDKCLNLYYLSGCWQAFGVGEKKMFARAGDGDYILPMMREALTGIISEGTHHQERAETIFEQLNSYLAMKLEPTDDEMNPPPEPEKKYRFSLGDTVYLGTQEYSILAFDDNEVRLYDESFPLLNKLLSRGEFDAKLRENPLNDHLLQAVETVPEEPDEKKVDSYGAVKSEYPNAIVAYQVGDFFEFYGEDARTAAEALDLMLTSKMVDGERVPMCGIPGDRLSTYTDMLLDRGHDVAISELQGTEHHTELLTSTHKEAPVDSRPVGRIDFLGSDGKVGDTIEYIDEAKFIRDIKEENHYGSPMTITVYREADGSTIPTDFVQNLDPSPQGFEIVDSPYLRLDRVKEAETQESAEPSEKETEPLTPPQPKRKQRAQSFDLHPEIPQAERRNFRITDDDLGVGTPSEHYANNVAAIRLLKRLEAESRYATSVEQGVLSKYVGWGGLADCFDEKHSKYGELKALLSEDEYAAARESTLTAFYTPPVVIRSMYQALENMNFKAGNVLEPSCGVGNFLGMLPQSMEQSKLYGVELDSISGRIAQQLYQKSSVAVQGFEKTDLPDSFFDAAIGNVPFGQFKVPDKRYDKNNFLIHDYFFARTLDKVRPGGIIAFITSKGTMDKENPAVRKYITQRADLLGAIRLPNNTFKSAAGTEATSDIIFLQKRNRLIDIEPDWVHLNTDENGVTMNQYFIDNPDMILGEMKMVSGPFGPESACVPYEGQDLGEQLSDAIQNIHSEITEFEVDELEEETEDLSVPADPTVRNFSFALSDGKLYYRENSRMNPVEVSVTAENRIKGMIAIRDCARTLIEYQTEDYPDSDIQAEQEKLNILYDDFSKKYGIINVRANSSAFSNDSSYPLLASLEVLDDEGNFVRKADMFSKRTIKQRVVITSVDTASEALSISLSEKAKVDMEYMAELTGKTEQEIFANLQGVIFLNPMHTSDDDNQAKYLPADEYLSGNVREKLQWARHSAELCPQDYASNVQALEAVQPVNLTASEISVRLGATWLPPELIEQFTFELFSTPRYCQWNIHVHYSEYTGEWNIEGKNYDRGNIQASNTYGTGRINGYKIIEETLNLRDMRIFDYLEDADGRKQAVLNRKETAIAQGKQELIKQAFADWIWKDPECRERLCKLYNEKFNSNRAREYDGSFLNLVGINPEISLRKHQINAVARGILGGNELLAHVVGAGKTYTMTAIAQESKRLGFCQKSLFVVPNHLTEQWASEYLQLYPAANILVASKKDFEAKNRKKFCGRIATGDYDAIIIGHSQFEKIPMSIERQRAILEQQLEEILEGISEVRHNRGDSFSVKQLEKTKKTVKQKIEKLNDQSRKDDLVTFEELGIDRVFIDEAHYYKNLVAFSKMRNVGGISQTEAMKSSDLYMKCRYLDELTGGKGMVFATGTPISNSMVEMYTMQKYLQYGTLKRNNLLHFDSWASTFGETVTAIELAPEGTGYRAKTRFAKFYNLPELIMMFREVADIQTADMLRLPVPKANYHNIVLNPSDQQKEMVAALAERAERVRNKMVDSSVDNMLLITNDGRKLALDQRLMNEFLPDSETGKSAACAQNVFDIWQRTREQRSTQMVFCDLSTPHGDGKFNVYDDVRDKLIARGIPAEEIAYIHSANTEVQKKELFGKVRSGQIRVLIGSTQKMGAGTNVQQKLVAEHHLDCPWRPSDLQQREGRIIRQGNENPEVEIFSYATEGTFDAYLYQLVESKQKFIGQIMTSKSPVRSAEDIDETALSYAEIKALASGNPHIKEKMDLDIDVARLKLLKANHLSQKYALEDQIVKFLPQQMRSYEERMTGLKKDMAQLTEQTHPSEDGFSPMELQGTLYTDKKEAGTALLAACKAMTSPDAVPLGQYRGFSIELSFDSFSREFKVTLKGALRHPVSLGADIFGNIQRLDNALAALPEQLTVCGEQLENAKTQLANAKIEVEKPFPREDELKTKTARLDELNILLNMDKRENEIGDTEPDEDAPAKSTKEMER